MEWILLILSLLSRSTRAASPVSSPSPAAAPAPTRAVATTATPAKRPDVAVKAATQPAPWPVAASEKAKLPAFPGPEWEPDLPVRPAVMARAVQLIGPLHQAGKHTIELTEGRWIAYAPKMHGTKKAVEAFRRKKQSSSSVVVSPKVPLAQTRPSTPIEPVVMSTPVPVAPKAAAPVVVSPVVSPPAPSTPAASAASTIPPTLRRGSQGPDVVTVQRLVGAEPDGKFGPKTEAAVRAYQSANGLQSDGIVGPKTWASLLGAN